MVGKQDTVDSIADKPQGRTRSDRRQNMLKDMGHVATGDLNPNCTMSKAITRQAKPAAPASPQVSRMRDDMAAVAPRKGNNIDPDDPIGQRRSWNHGSAALTARSSMG